MGLGLKDIPAIDAKPLENAVAIERSMIEDAQLGVMSANQFTVQPDFHFVLQTRNLTI